MNPVATSAASRCECIEVHQPRIVVLTGGPGAGKTAVLELIRQSFCEHVKVLPEAAGVVFGGGFPRVSQVDIQRAAQRAIFYMQRELEAAALAERPAVVLCDRGTIDGSAYWVGAGDLWSQVGTTLDEQLARYDAVIHLRTPPDRDYNHSNPLRVESGASARDLDTLILHAWERHPRRFIVEPHADFMEKAAQALAHLRGELPACCQHHRVVQIDSRRPTDTRADHV